MPGYYAEKLSAERLRLCYEIAPPRVKRYLEAEIRFVLERLPATGRVLELGCGYGRALARLLAPGRELVGIDTSAASLELARRELPGPCLLAQMDAAYLGFRDGVFDALICIQNGISAFALDRSTLLLSEALRVTRAGGLVLLSSYSARFWEPRLEWFRLQAERGLLGAIDEEATGDGVIVCRDGFRATTVGEAEFSTLCADCGVAGRLTEVDGSSLFCEVRLA